MANDLRYPGFMDGGPGSSVVSLLSPFRMVVAERLPLAHAAVIGSYLLRPPAPAVPRSVAWCKRIIDIVGSVTALILLSPIMLVAALLVAWSGRPVFFSQTRIGHNGESFKCYKFRSMVPDAENVLKRILEHDAELRAEWMCGQKLRRDPRITRLGRFLRKTSIDELPQLWNVLKGDMSLVGPRPILPSQIVHYGRGAKWYLAMRPGITGLWQVTARGDEDFDRRVRLDCAYARNYRFIDDFMILIKTVGVVVSGRGAM
jgi:lipopolysaccharide/colanic/teichoic acid biosynthesis glycosyltransferase